jgi:DNA-directed RNA polymerase specialized sigma24 family protein
MDNLQHGDLLKELKRITKLLTMIATKDMKQKDQIRILDSLKFQPKEIAELLGTSANAVRVSLHSIRKKEEPKKEKIKRLPTEDK